MKGSLALLFHGECQQSGLPLGPQGCFAVGAPRPRVIRREFLSRLPDSGWEETHSFQLTWLPARSHSLFSSGSSFPFLHFVQSNTFTVVFFYFLKRSFKKIKLHLLNKLILAMLFVWLFDLSLRGDTERF